MESFRRHVQERASGTDHAELWVDILRKAEIRNLNAQVRRVAGQKDVLWFHVSVNYCRFLGMSR
jgi:ssRNA-specific RNase YbeY (16S rRNA maturation enzyme)